MQNKFGLFKNVYEKNIRIVLNEKTSKYLLARSYIPNNFDEILVGPSYSDYMMDTKRILNHEVYNLSMDGGNISELRFAVDGLLSSKKIKTLIICLDPYLTKNHGRKTTQLTEQDYWATLGSLFTLKYYMIKLMYVLKPDKNIYWDSQWGYTDITARTRDSNVTHEINKTVLEINTQNWSYPKMDPIAYNQLKNMLLLARKNDVKIYAYFYAHPLEIFNVPKYNIGFKKFKADVSELFTSEDTVWDYNTKEYDYIRAYVKNYSDRGHLSRQGANLMLDDITNRFNAKK